MDTGPSTNSTTITTTQKPTQALLEFCFPKDAEPLPAYLGPLPSFVIIDCGNSQYCDPIDYEISYMNDTLIGKYLGYSNLFIISYQHT